MNIQLPPQEYEKIKPRWMPVLIWSWVESWYPAKKRIAWGWQQLDQTIIVPNGKRYNVSGSVRYTTPDEQREDAIASYWRVWNAMIAEIKKELEERSETED